ncbi:MAG: hypothetical protein RI909_1096 [Bacteroidota bacterium]|jgi:hypothetical protein
MEKSNKTTSIVDTESNDIVTTYFQRAGSFGYIVVMAIFYIALIAIFSLT